MQITHVKSIECNYDQVYSTKVRAVIAILRIQPHRVTIVLLYYRYYVRRGLTCSFTPV